MSSEPEPGTGEGVRRRLKRIVDRVDSRVRRSVDESLANASDAVVGTLDSVEDRTRPGQLAALRAYRSFLGRQERAAASRISELERRKRTGP